MLQRSTVWIMALTGGLVVANNYYNQPLLVEFAHTFGVTEKAVGPVAALTQFGYAFGMLVFLPLSDMFERKRMIRLLILAAICALVATALSPSIHWLIVAGFVVGFTCVVPQLVTPFAAQLADPKERGSVVGIVMGGLLTGILLSRTIAGFVGAHLGWQAMYWIAAGIMVVLYFVLGRTLPQGPPTFKGSYVALMRSLHELIRTQPVLRETSLVAALQFAAFSAFWTTLVFHLHNLPSQYGSDVAGAFGLVGVLGALMAPYAGKLSDRTSPRLTVMLSSIAFVIAYIAFGFIGYGLLGIAVGVVILDLGMQSGHVSNMTRNFALNKEALGRLNTVYNVTRFLGGGLGSVAGNLAWVHWQWPGVCIMGGVLSLLAIGVQLYYGRRYVPQPQSA
ncbi:MFS transporter [uncultured Oxalicibacterium sp.]|uniref:MFS transporter n=1 Tax=uncultured Oxalicibacterium sp. TaxID=1168540 RepID=UPI0025F69DF3|nr:MFS transporter [uncultured Oxalicibacterium sp.]